MKGLVLLIGLAAVACAAAVYLATRKPDKQIGARGDSAGLAEVPVTPAPGAGGGSAAPVTSEVRRQVQNAVDRAAPSTDKAQAEEVRREPVAPAPPAGQALDELRAIGDRIRRETDIARREALIRGYIQQVATLPPAEKAQAMTRLNELAGVAASQPQAGPDVASRWAAVERAEGPARQEAIARLLETVRRLPPEEQTEHMQRLKALVQTAAPAR